MNSKTNIEICSVSKTNKSTQYRQGFIFPRIRPWLTNNIQPREQTLDRKIFLSSSNFPEFTFQKPAIYIEFSDFGSLKPKYELQTPSRQCNKKSRFNWQQKSKLRRQEIKGITITFQFYIDQHQQFLMSTNQCLNSSQTHFHKFIDDRGDKTRSTQNLSKLCENCRLLKDELQAQIFTLKDKSHQSFMQVIQVQQLHEEEMQLMKVQHQQQILGLRQEISKLEIQVNRHQSDLLAMQKNSKHHIFHLEQPSFIIENIDMIECNQDFQKKCKLDDSSFDQFNEFVDYKLGNLNEQGLPRNKQNQFLKQPNPQSLEKIQKLSLKIMELEAEVESLWETNQQLKKECLKLEANQKSIKNNYDSLYKESKFMADHIRTLANDKFKLQRKVKELQKEIRDTKVKGMKQSSILDDDKQSQMSIKINGSDIFNQNDLDKVRNSFENFTQQNNPQIATRKSLNSNQNSPIPQIISKQDLQKPHQTESLMTKSEMFSNNNDIQARKSMPNYKKVSHISPSFKKSSVPKVQQNIRQSNPLLKVENQEWRDNDKSDFMDEINREIERKTNLKKSTGPHGFYQEKQRVSSIPDKFRKRSSAQ